VGKTCGAGTTCDSTGSCVDACTGVVCPKGQSCTMGKCVASTTGGDGGVDGGDDSGTPSFDGGFGSDDASIVGDTGTDSSPAFQDDGKEAPGCGCSTPVSAPASAGWLALAFAILLRRRR
jgi:uncharacterized protein (TIGR03382 family)